MSLDKNTVTYREKKQKLIHYWFCTCYSLKQSSYVQNPNQTLKSTLYMLSLQLNHISKEINAVTAPAELPPHCSLIKHVCLAAYGEAHITYGGYPQFKTSPRVLLGITWPWAHQLYSLMDTDSITSNHYHNFPQPSTPFVIKTTFQTIARHFSRLANLFCHM